MARAVDGRLGATRPFDISSLFTLSSGGALQPGYQGAHSTPTVKPDADRRVRVLGNGGAGGAAAPAGEKFEGLNRFAPDPTSTLVMAEDLTVVEPGSDVIGRVAQIGVHPIAYYGDEAKTSATFVVVDGTRWVLTGDPAMVDTDGSIRLLGRGSGCIDGGGEKVFPEEVEAATKSHPAVYDCVVAGAPDERWGETVVALVGKFGHGADDRGTAMHCRSWNRRVQAAAPAGDRR